MIKCYRKKKVQIIRPYDICLEEIRFEYVIILNILSTIHSYFMLYVVKFVFKTIQIIILIMSSIILTIFIELLSCRDYTIISYYISMEVISE